nr:AbiEi antitoxin N-terminal domain-containing protein [Piscinibacter sp. XHJ-5]
MTGSSMERVMALAADRRLLRGSDLHDVGLSPQLLIKLHQAGKLQRVFRGVYSLPDAPVTEHQSLAEVCRRVPKGVVCLLSALRFHEIGTQAPHEVWLALPESSRTPAVSFPALRIVRLRGEAYSESIETVMEEGASIRVYSTAKTITDCFKFRHKIGLDVALEALKDAWQRRLVKMDDLSRFARINRVERVMQPYLEALVA